MKEVEDSLSASEFTFFIRRILFLQNLFSHSYSIGIYLEICFAYLMMIGFSKFA